MRRGLLAGLTISVALAMLPAAAQAASISLEPDAGPPGQTVGAEGGGFADSCGVEIRFEQTAVAQTTPDANGGFATSFAVPDDAAPDTATVTAVGLGFDQQQQCAEPVGPQASASFTVQSPDEPAFDYRVFLQTRVLGDPGIDQAFLDDIRAGDQPRHGIVQLHSLPRPGRQDLATLETLGIDVLEHLGGVGEGASTAYLGTIAPDVAADEPAFDELVRGLQPLAVEDKLAGAVASMPAGEETRLLGQVFVDVADQRAEEVFPQYTATAEATGSPGQWLLTDLTPEDAAALAAEDIIQWIEPALEPGPTLSTVRSTHDIDDLQDYDPAADAYGGLTGADVQIGIMDTGVDTSHDDVAGRLLRRNDDSEDHGTHVAAIAAGNGSRSDGSDDAGTPNGGTKRQWRGVAPAADIAPYGFADDADTLSQAVDDLGVDVSNHSYAYAFQGAYTARAQRIDRTLGLRAFARPMVFAAGNNANLGGRDCDGDGTNDVQVPQYPRGCGQPFKAGYFSILAPAKNPITVGNVTPGLALWPSSSLGPTMDGRLKPDVVAIGQSVRAAGGDRNRNGNPTPGNGYRSKTGTSMAAPAVTGTVALLLERHAALTGAALDADPPLPSTLKAILAQTAIDLVGSTGTNFDTGLPTAYGDGPDWATGFGAIDPAAAVSLLEANSYLEDRVAPGRTTVTHDIPVSEGQTGVRVTLAWDDRPGSPNSNDAAIQLVNDLDLELVEPDGTVHRPLVLPAVAPLDCDGDASNGTQVTTCVGADGTQNYQGPASEGTDRRNNVEQVRVAGPDGLAEGTWTARVSVDGGDFLRLPLLGGQDYSLAWDAPGATTRTPDRLEANDTPATATDVTLDAHDHFDERITADTTSPVTTTRERWRTELGGLSLHDADDVDHFRLDVPDPGAEHPDVHPDPDVTEPLPDCGVLERRRDPLPRETPEEAVDFIYVNGALRGGATFDTPVAEVLERGFGSPPPPRSFELPCPGEVVDDCPECLTLTLGATTAGSRTRFAPYDLGLTYDIVLQRAPRISGWLRDIRDAYEGREGANVLPLRCGDTVFPACADGPFELGVTHPVGPRPDCRADGPGCEMHVPFHWDAAATFDLRIASETALEVDLLAADESLIASAERLPHSGGPAAVGSSAEEDLVETRLLAEDLDAGFHVLRFRGEPTPMDLLLAAPPPGRVQRLAGASRLETAVAVSQATFDTSDAVVLARADEYADALSGAPLAAQLDAPILLTGRDALSGVTAAEIARLGADEAVLLGGEAALSPQVDADLAAAGLATRRVSGPTRFATAAAVARELDGAPTTAFVTEGAHADPARGWPDALAAAPVAAFTGRPVLLVTREQLPAATADALDVLGVTETIVAGGTAAISDAVVDEMDAAGHDPRRVFGATRYATARALYDEAVTAGMDPDGLWLATGAAFPDALAAGPAIATAGETLLLTGPDRLSTEPADVVAARRDTLRRVTVLGGTAAVSAQVGDELRDLLAR